MKRLLLILIGLTLAVSVSAYADTTTSSKKKAPKKAGQNLSTDITFNDSTLHGHYQTPDEANARVENEKALDDLLSVRTNFKDRLKRSSEQN